jgi:hypothetical protein
MRTNRNKEGVLSAFVFHVILRSQYPMKMSDMLKDSQQTALSCSCSNVQRLCGLQISSHEIPIESKNTKKHIFNSPYP